MGDAAKERFLQLLAEGLNDETIFQAIREGEMLKVLVNGTKRAVTVQCRFATYVHPGRRRRLEEFLRRCLPGVEKVRVISFFPPINKPGDFLRLWKEEILLYLREEFPAVAVWIKDLYWNEEKGKIFIVTAGEIGATAIESRQVPATLQEILAEDFGLEVLVAVETQEEVGTDPLQLCWEEEEKLLRSLQEEIANGNKERKEKEEDKGGVLVGKVIAASPRPLREVQEEEKGVVVRGQVFNLEVRELKSGRRLVVFDLTDFTDSITCKLFTDREDVAEAIKKDMWLLVRGDAVYDRFDQELVLQVNDVNVTTAETREDRAEEKRVELHAHTKMSAMDSVADVEALIARAAAWGHEAIAITDHGVVQAFPEAYEAGKKYGIKVIYGMEGYLIDDGDPIVINVVPRLLDRTEYVVFDLETTGLSPLTCDIIEIGAVKIKEGEIKETFHTFVTPSVPLPRHIQELTGITPAMLAGAPPVDQALQKFLDFVGDAVLVAHNAQFDAGFVRTKMKEHFGTSLTNPILDTLGLARILLPDLKSHRLKNLAEELGVPLEKHHRAVDDAAATARIFTILLDKLKSRGIYCLTEINSLLKERKTSSLPSYHIILLVKNEEGMKNLYRLVSLSHLHHFHRTPRIPKSELIKHREGLLLGTACEAGQLVSAYLEGASQERLEEIARFYDFLEIQPRGNNRFLVREGRLAGEEDILKMNRTIVELGEKLGLPVVATGDVHFIDPHEAIFRAILMAGKGFADADDQAPLYFRTTEEMLAEFAYLGEEKAREVVIDAPRRLAEMIEQVKPMPDEFFPPQIEGADEEIRNMAISRAQELYGSPLPELVEKRLEKELNAIINNGFAVLYLIAHKLVKKSNEDGYLVGSRGSVGSSFVATMTGITEVNPLPPHYRCPSCRYSQFITDGSYGCGADMPDADCPRCGTRMVKDGHDIPFEVFMGFEGDKVPDIDLNFSGEYQARAHKYTEELFGSGYVFRAGTIGTIAEKTAYGFVKNYLEERGIKARSAEVRRLVGGCTGVKRTTGQHPGGVMVVPRDKDIHDFTPLQYPADDASAGVITTHFDYHSISGRIVKLDILGHDDPTVIKMLEDLTGVDARTIPLDEPKVLSLFSSTEALGVTPEEIRSPVGTYGIPEFGTRFVRQMLEDTRPRTFSELVRISGFSHGTDVWLNNAQDLIKSGTCTLSEAISTRDDIMIYLIHKGMEPARAFKIMEGVRKGKGVKPEDVEAMRACGVPDWYIQSCQKIKYMFPKAHAVAYVMMAFRIAYFKVYYPEAFYATYFTVRAEEFDADLIAKGKDAVLRKIEEIERQGNGASARDKNLLTILEVALEMYARGIKMRKVDLWESDATRFLITPTGLLPPFAALQGVGETAARNIVAAREEAPFTSVEDLRTRARVSKTVIEVLEQHGALRGLSETDQLQLFM